MKNWFWAGAVSAVVVLVALAFPVFGSLLPWMKALPCVFWALACAWGPYRNRLWGTVALMGSALADYLLAQPDALLPGVAVFLAVQGVYAARFWGLALGQKVRGAALWSPPVIYGSIFAAAMIAAWPHLGTLALPFVVYGTFLVAMASGSLASRGGPHLVWGGLLFFISDALILARFAVTVPQPWWEWAVLVPYYAGQALLCLGLVYLQGGERRVSAA